MDALYRAAYRRRNGREPKLAPGWFRRMAEVSATGIDAMLTWRGGHLAGTSFNLAAGDYNVVGVSRWTSGTGYVIADAIRIRTP